MEISFVDPDKLRCSVAPFLNGWLRNLPFPLLRGARSPPEQHPRHHDPRRYREQREDAGQPDRAQEDIRQPRKLRGFDDLDDDRILQFHFGQESALNASSASVRTATPLGPFGI